MFPDLAFTVEPASWGPHHALIGKFRSFYCVVQGDNLWECIRAAANALEGHLIFSEARGEEPFVNLHSPPEDSIAGDAMLFTPEVLVEIDNPVDYTREFVALLQHLADSFEKRVNQTNN